MYVTAHLLFDRIQLFGLKIPPAPPSPHEIIPIMDEDGFAASETVAVNATLPPEEYVAGFGVSVVTVPSSVDVDMLDTAELPECWLSPPYVALIFITFGGFTAAT